MKFKNYWEPTPKNIRKAGDAFLALAAYGEIHSTTINPCVGHILVYLGLGGKFLSNFFAEDNDVKS